MNPSPRDFGVPHDEWRPNQYEFIRDALASVNKYNFGELAVGSGKSAIATALGKSQNVTVHVHTLSLLDQYKREYGFAIVKGRQEYPCVLQEKVDEWKSRHNLTPTAFDCHFAPMWECPVSADCPYLRAKEHAKNARRTACTYRYGATSDTIQQRDGFLICDEGHAAAEELIEFNTFTMKWKTILEFDLPKFPLPVYGEDNEGARVIPIVHGMIKDWVWNCIRELNNIPMYDEMIDPMSAKIRRLIDRLKKFAMKLDTVDWFLHVNVEGIELKALSAKHIAQEIFATKDKVFLMSGTIGDPEPLAHELGFEAFMARTYPHPIPVQYRPIDILDVEKMTYYNLKNDDELYFRQAERIASWIDVLDPSFRGLIATSSYYKIKRLGEYMKDFFPEKRFFIQDGEMSVSHLVNKFVEDTTPGAIAIGSIQGWGTGVDLRGDIARYVVIAGVPFTNPRDQYAKARREVSGGQKYQLWVTHNQVMQLSGRVTRGQTDENGEFLTNWCAIADGSAVTNRAMKYYSPWFKEAMNGN